MTAENALLGKLVEIAIDEPGEWRSRDGSGRIRGRIDRVVPLRDDHALAVIPEYVTSFKRIGAPDWMLEKYGIRLIGEVIVNRLWLVGRYDEDRTLNMLEGKEVYVNIAVIPPQVEISSSEFNPRRDLIGVGYGRVSLLA